MITPGMLSGQTVVIRDKRIESIGPFLANDITTVLNLYGTPLHLKLRSAVDRGEALGPSIFTSGPTVGTAHGEQPTTTPKQIDGQLTAQ
jgi:hypothetical protein